jgi:cardiolipin synthase A/B
VEMLVSDLLRDLLRYTPVLLDAALLLLSVAMWPSILLSRKQPVAMLAWLLGVTFFPVLGPAFYLAFGRQRRLPGLPRKKARSDRAIGPLLDSRIGTDPQPGQHLERVPEGLRASLAVASRVGRFSPAPGNRLQLCDGAAQKYEALLRDIAAARHHVHLEYYILRADGFGERLAAALEERAAAGVQVRLLMDGVGSIFLSRRYIARLRAAGMRFEWFHPLNPLRRRWSLNIRNHRKIAVIDGRIGYVGGINLGDEYLGRDATSGQWHDLALRLEGPAVLSLQRVFSEDWHFSTGELLGEAEHFPPPQPVPGGSLVQIVNSEPSDELVVEMHQIYFACLGAARRRAWLMTPYFLPDEIIQTALASQALGGADVRVLVTRRIREHLVAFASRAFFPAMVEAGVRMFRFRPDATLHAKALLVDDALAILGSANLDERSFRINYETGALIHDPAFARTLEACILSKLERAHEVTAAELRARPRILRTLESLARLAAPLF